VLCHSIACKVPHCSHLARRTLYPPTKLFLSQNSDLDTIDSKSLGTLDLEALEALEANKTVVTARVDGIEQSWKSELDTVNTKIDTKFDALITKIDTKFDAMITKIDTKFDTMITKLDDVKMIYLGILGTLLVSIGGLVVSIFMGSK